MNRNRHAWKRDLKSSHGIEKGEIFILDELAGFQSCLVVSNTFDVKEVGLA